MKRKLHNLLLAALPVLIFNTAQSAVAQDTNVVSMTLREAENMAMTNHPKITQAELIALASAQVVRETRSSFFPRISADVTSVGTTGSNTRVAAGALNNPLILERNAEGVTATQLITDFGRTANLTASSKLQARAQDQNALATRAQILVALDSAYFSALQAQSILGVAKQTVATRQYTFDQVSQLATNKLKSGLDVSFAQVDLDTSKLLLANANNDLQSAFAELSNVLGDRQQRSFHLAEEPIPASSVPDDPDLVQTTLRNRPDLVQLRLESDAAQRFARAQRDLHYPTISAVGTAGVIPIHEPALKQNYAAAGVNLSLPIFEGMLFDAREKEAQLRARAAAENLRDAEDNAIRDVRVAALNVTYAQEQLTLTAQLLASANQAFELAQTRYKVGSSSIVELSQAQLNQTEAQIAQAKARYQFQIRDAILNYQLGNTTSTNNPAR